MVLELLRPLPWRTGRVSTTDAPRTIDPGSRAADPATVAWVEVDGEGLLYDEVRKRVHVLSPTATLIWSGIDGRDSLNQIARDLSDSFGVDAEVVRSDVLDLASELMDKGLIAEARQGRAPIETDVDEPTEPGRRFLEEPPGG